MENADSRSYNLEDLDREMLREGVGGWNSIKKSLEGENYLLEIQDLRDTYKHVLNSAIGVVAGVGAVASYQCFSDRYPLMSAVGAITFAGVFLAGCAKNTLDTFVKKEERRKKIIENKKIIASLEKQINLGSEDLIFRL